MAAPVGGQILGEILPYLEVEKGNKDEIDQTEEIEAPDIVGKTIKEAEKILKEQDLTLVMDEIEDVDKENTKVKNQVPKARIKINKGTNIYVE